MAFTRSRRTAALAAGALMALSLTLTGCSQPGAADTGITAATGVQPVTGRPQPVENPDKKQVRIAILTAPPALAEYFKAVNAGATRAANVLKSRGAKVDYVSVTDFSASGMNAAVRTAITQKYDGIIATMLGPANCEPLKEATAAGIKVAAMIASADCAESTGALFFHGEDSSTAWKDVVAPAMVKATGGKKCKVGIITGSFAVPQHEARRTGFLSGLSGSSLTAVNKGVEAGVDPAKFQAAARDYVTANPDLCGILVTVGDNGAAAAALTADQAKNIKVIAADLTTGDVQQIKSGKLYGTFTQDPFGESYDSAIWMYNAVITGKGPSGGFLQPVKGTFVTKSNLTAAVNAQSDGR